MKKVLVIVLSVLIALCGALLSYGATLNGEIQTNQNLGDLLPPVNPDAYAEGIAEWIRLNAVSHERSDLLPETNPSKDPAVFAAEIDGWYDVFGKKNEALSVLNRFEGSSLAGNLIVPLVYNMNRAKQFCMVSHIEVFAGNKRTFSDNMRVRAQIEPFAFDRFYRALSWTGSSIASFASLRVGFADQTFVAQNTVSSYDKKSGTYVYQFGKPQESSRDRELDREIPYKTYGLISLPIYLGDWEVDCSVVDGKSVRVDYPSDNAPYYVLSFSEDIEKAGIPENTENRLNRSLGGKMRNITIKKADFTVEIWESGVFRRIGANFTVNAKIGGRQGDAEIEAEYKFYYDDASCDIIRLIESVGWEKYLSAANKEEFESRKNKKYV